MFSGCLGPVLYPFPRSAAQTCCLPRGPLWVSQPTAWGWRGNHSERMWVKDGRTSSGRQSGASSSCHGNPLCCCCSAFPSPAPLLLLLTFQLLSYWHHLVLPLLLLLPLRRRALHQTDVTPTPTPPMCWQWLTTGNSSRGSRSTGAEGGESHPETSHSALTWPPSWALSCLLSPCLPKVEAKASQRPLGVVPPFGFLDTDH